jgi:Spy/CpxP family protein refolding chaperone
MKASKLALAVALCGLPLLARAQGDLTPLVEPDEASPVLVSQRSQPQAPLFSPGGSDAGSREGERTRAGPGPMGGGEPEVGTGLGAWWKNSEIVAKLQLSDAQVKKIQQTFLSHRLNLIDLQADLEKQELRLQPLLDVDQPDENKVNAQIDLITTARGRLEKENAELMLDIRRCLTSSQWKKLKALRPQEEGGSKSAPFPGGQGPRPGPGGNAHGPVGPGGGMGPRLPH